MRFSLSTLRLPFLSAALGLLLVQSALLAQVVETPPIDIDVTPLDREVVIEWSDPDAERISNLIVIDSSWGGTATLEVSGGYTGHCDMDITFRTTNSTDLFVKPFVDTVFFQNTDMNRPNYWTGSAVPYAGGEPDICEDHNMQLIALDGAVLTDTGTVFGAELAFFWLDVPDTGTVHLPAGFRAGVDSMELTRGVWFGFEPGAVNEGDEFTIRSLSKDIQFAWSYVLTGGEETERVSSSDPGEEEITICGPGEVVPFRFGLSILIRVDTLFDDLTEIVSRDSIEPGGDTITVYDTITTSVPVFQGSVPTGGDTLGVVSALWRKIDGYRIYRSDITNPERFVLLKEYSFCYEEDLDFLLNDPIRYVDTEGVHNGFPYTYFVTAFDTLTHSESPDSLRSAQVFPRTEAEVDMNRISVVPNPYKRNAAWEDGSERIQFTHLPVRATIRVYTVGGDLVREWEHDDPSGGGNSDWNMRNENDDLVVSGVYIFYVKSAAGAERVGKFIIVR